MLAPGVSADVCYTTILLVKTQRCEGWDLRGRYGGQQPRQLGPSDLIELYEQPFKTGGWASRSYFHTSAKRRSTTVLFSYHNHGVYL